jgi:thymidylate kinase
MVIEFARNDYQRAFQKLTGSFLADSYFLYLDTDIKTCRQRIRERSEKKSEEKTEDDYFVSESIFETYYQYEEGKPPIDVLDNLKRQGYKTMYIENTQDLASLLQKIDKFVAEIMHDVASPSIKNVEQSTPIAPLSSYPDAPSTFFQVALF